MNGRVYSSDVYVAYNGNAIQHEQNFVGKAFTVGGYATKIRRDMFDEHIVELQLTSNPFYDLNVVCPSGISQAKINGLTKLNITDHFKAVMTKCKRDVYVNVLCYLLNGKTKTEP